jgi:hypothetical protein
MLDSTDNFKFEMSYVKTKRQANCGPLKLSFHSSFKLAHSCQKKPKLHTNSLNKLLFRVDFITTNENQWHECFKILPTQSMILC